MATQTDEKNRASKDAATSAKPKSGTDSLESHAVPASQIAAQVDKGVDKSRASANAASMDAVSEQLESAEDRARAEFDKSLFGRIAKSGLVFVNDHTSGRQYVGIPPNTDPDATEATKILAAVFPLSSVAPKTGMLIRPKDGDPFNVPDGFGTDSTPDRWAGVVRPDGKALFAE